MWDIMNHDKNKLKHLVKMPKTFPNIPNTIIITLEMFAQTNVLHLMECVCILTPLMVTYNLHIIQLNINYNNYCN